MKLQEIFSRLRGNRCNHLEFFSNGQKVTKSFDDVYRDVAKVASYLTSLQLTPGDKVGIWAENSYEWVLVDMACLATGCISVPFHEDFVVEQLVDYLAKYQVRLTFADHKNLAKLGSHQGVLPIEKVLRQEAGLNIGEQVGEDSAERIFSIVFTSGTTSTPKPIALRHKSFDDFITNIQGMFEFRVDDKVIIILPLSHFGQRSYIYGAFLVGFDVVMSTPQNIFFALQSAAPTIVVGVPYFYENLFKVFQKKIRSDKYGRLLYPILQHLSDYLPVGLRQALQSRLFRDFHQFWGGRMRIMATGSAPISKQALQFYHASGLTLYEAYGTNETGLIALNHPGCLKIGSVGKPFPNKQVKIEGDGQIVVQGEFCWAKEYYQTVNECSDNFRADGSIATGDIGFLDRKGFLHIKGRKKEMIVLCNGKKVHPNMLEAEINRCDLIKQSAVFGENMSSLCAILVKADSELADEEVLQEMGKINKRLPEYARIVNHVLTSEAFTVQNCMLNSNMKLNRSAIYDRYQAQLRAFC